MAAIEQLPQSEEQSQDMQSRRMFRYWRLRVFYSMFIGYALFYFTRKSFIFVMPAMISDLGFDKAQLGFLASVLSIAYAFSKFTSGILADKTNPRLLMGIGLVITGIINVCFGLSSSLIAFALLWGLNGVFQGFGAPPCAKLLIHWFSQKERGTWWSIWNTSHNIGGALIPILVGVCIHYFGWRYGMYVPGIICIIGGLWLINRLRDTPESLGLPSVEQYQGECPISTQTQNSGSTNQPEKLSVREILFDHIFKNKFILMLGIAYFFVYTIRTAVNDWTALYLVEEKNYDIIGAGGVVCWFEVGGFFGSLVAGWMSDRFFLGKRGPVSVLFTIGVLITVSTFWLMSTKNAFIDAALIFTIGFLIFGPQMLVGMAAAELTDKKAAATATGFVGCFAYLGAATAGYPLGKIAQEFGWGGYFAVLTACCIIALLLLIPLWSVVSEQSRIRYNLAPNNAQKEVKESLA